jgi:hypothetical protein
LKVGPTDVEFRSCNFNKYQWDKVNMYVNKLKMAHSNQLKNVKTIAARLASDWLSKKAKSLAKTANSEIC